MLKIITAAERLQKQKKTNIIIFGPSGVGKTTQARTLNPDTTLFLDLEGGTLALEGDQSDLKKNPPWAGDIIKIREVAQSMGAHPWEITRAITCLITGPDPLSPPDGPYSAASFAAYSQHLADPKTFEKYDTIFLDSITVASRWAFKWAQTQPAAFSEKTGKPDNRGAYGLLGQEMVTWMTNVQHCDKSIIAVGILDEQKDDLGRISYTPQIEGSKSGRDLPGIFDEVLSLVELKTEAGQKYRAFVCHLQNDWSFPAKDRSGTLGMIEEPNLAKLIAKIRAGKRIDTTIETAIPKES